jgi:hypothetical protein
MDDLGAEIALSQYSDGLDGRGSIQNPSGDLPSFLFSRYRRLFPWDKVAEACS